MTTLSTTSLLMKQKNTLSAHICDKYVGWSINYFSQVTKHYTSSSYILCHCECTGSIKIKITKIHILLQKKFLTLIRILLNSTQTHPVCANILKASKMKYEIHENVHHITLYVSNYVVILINAKPVHIIKCFAHYV